MLWQILGIATIILLIVFFAFTLRILFVFTIGFKKNKVLNKSVSKNVFSGKLSLSIILIFFMVSFGLVGGMQLMNTSGSRTLEKQFDENSVFLAESKDYTISIADRLKNASAQYYNEKNNDKVLNTSFVNDLLIEYTLSSETINIFNGPDHKYNDIPGTDSDAIDPEKVFKSSSISASPPEEIDNIFSDLNQETIGWTTDEWERALKAQLTEQTKNWEINTYLGGDISFIDTMVNIFFDGSYQKIGKFIFAYNIFSNPIPENSNGLPEYDENVKIVNTFIDELSFKITSYINVTPLASKGKTDFEFVLINDLNLSKIDGGGSISTNAEDKFIKISNDGRETNKISFVDGDGVSSTEEFRQLSSMSMSTNSDKGLQQTYKVLVQEDFLIANNLSVGDIIPFGNTNTEFEISGSVRFNEITYPSMGMNIIPDKEHQALIGINLSDFLIFTQKNEYSSITSPEMKMFFGLDSTYDQLESISDWADQYSKIWSEFANRIYTFSSSVTYLNNSYNSPWEDILEQAKFWSKHTQGEVNTNWIQSVLNDSDAFHQTGIFVGWGTELNSFRIMNSWDSQESIRAILGLSAINNLSIMLKVMIGIFLTIVLIVLGMLVNKRIKSSSKQLGTLKAMGMKNKDIASSYILFPVIIILIGFLLASLISPIIMWAFTGLLSQYYYITFSAFALSWGYFVSILFIPLIMSISLAYGMSMWTLRKSTLDLLTNRTNDQPNIMVRAIGYVTPIKTPFAVSYVTKGMFRAVGKSSLLFVAIFLATFLSAFAMSSTTMIQKQTTEIMEYMNFETMQMGIVENKGQYKMEPLYFIDTDGELVLRSEDESDGYYFSYESVIVDGVNINKNALTPIEITDVQSEDVIALLKSSSDPFTTIYTLVHEIVFSPFDEYVLKSNIFDTHYFTDEYMEILFLSELSLGYLYNKTDSNISFSDWEDAQQSTDITDNQMTFSSIKPMIEPWAFQVAVNISKSGLLKDKDTALLNKINIIQKSTSDLVLGTYYYDQFYEVPNNSMDLDNSHMAINSAYNENYWESVKDAEFHEDTSSILILNDKKSFINAFGTIENKIGTSLWDSSFAQYFEEDGTVVEDLSYIPVVATTQSVVAMNQWVEAGFAEVNNGIYTLSVTIPVVISTKSEPDILWREDQAILIDVKVEEEVFIGVDVGGTTIKPLFEAYLENYNYDDTELLVRDDEANGYIFTYNGEEYIIHGDSYEDAFRSNYDGMSTVKNNNNGDGFMPKPGTENYIPAPASFVLTQSGEKEIWRSTDGYVSFNELFIDNAGNPKIGSGIEYTNGFPISMDILLEQGQVAYDLIISMFSIISLFAVFISTTIIIIAMKDIIDSSKREVSMLKAFGYSNTKSTFLIMTPYLFVMVLAVAISIPITFTGLALIAGIFTTMTGNVFIFSLSIIQWIILLGYVASISLVLLFLGYISFSRTNALEAIKETDE